MSTIYFDENLIKLAEQLLDVEDNYKAAQDISTIGGIFKDYNNGLGYNISNVITLDASLRKEYPCIDILENIANTMSVISTSILSTRGRCLDSYIEALNWDQKGILATVILKHNPNFKLSEFIVKAIE